MGGDGWVIYPRDLVWAQSQTAHLGGMLIAIKDEAE